MAAWCPTPRGISSQQNGTHRALSANLRNAILTILRQIRRWQDAARRIRWWMNMLWMFWAVSRL